MCRGDCVGGATGSCVVGLCGGELRVWGAVWGTV